MQVVKLKLLWRKRGSQRNLIDMIVKEENMIQIKPLQKEDFELVKAFVLSCHKDVANPDFFIVDDIDTALPAMFQSSGYVYGVYYNNELIAVHGVDLSRENHMRIFQHFPSYITDKPLAEMGWTMIRKSFQGKGIASLLITELEKVVSPIYDLVATVHPQNIVALKTYINRGFYGVALNEYYGKPRVFLIKRIGSQIRCDKTVSEYLIADMCSENFANKNLLVGVVKRNNYYYGQFARNLEEVI